MPANSDLNKFIATVGTTEVKFLSMQGVPPRRKSQLIVESRVGVADYAIWLEQTRGEMGQISTQADTDDFERDARIYNSMIGFTYKVVYDGQQLTDVYMIRHVDSRKGPLLFGQQIIAPNPPTAIIYATWNLFPVQLVV